MKLNIKESKRIIARKLLAIGCICTDLFLRRSPDQNCDQGIITAGLHGALYKLPDTTQFNN